MKENKGIHLLNFLFPLEGMEVVLMPIGFVGSAHEILNRIQKQISDNNWLGYQGIAF